VKIFLSGKAVWHGKRMVAAGLRPMIPARPVATDKEQVIATKALERRLPRRFGNPSSVNIECQAAPRGDWPSIVLALLLAHFLPRIEVLE
jgi:hypothetical protein